ncbi:MAG: hypothetical protein AAF253_12385 [Pseudomonadota bacterium]
MTAFRLLLAAMLLVLLAYTSFVIADHGMGLVPIFFGDMLEMGWPGQFNLDFFGFLILSALWTAWRSDFSALGLALAVPALTGGILFLTIYLLVLTSGRGANIRTVLLGARRAAA